MQPLNLHHLRLFLAVAREGSVSGAARKLGLTPQTVSKQVSDLEAALTETLLDRAGGAVRPTAAGRLVQSHAERIFAVEGELVDALRGGAAVATTVHLGVSDGFPKSVARALLQPLFAAAVPVRVVVDEDDPQRLLARLAAEEFDAVLSDAPAPPGGRARPVSRLLGESGVSWVAAPGPAEALRAGFPASLAGAPVVLPRRGTTLRTLLDGWMDEVGVRPRVVAEVADQALANSLAQSGVAAAVVPHAVLRAEGDRLGLVRVGRAGRLRERFYAITPERRLRHPALVALVESARRELFR